MEIKNPKAIFCDCVYVESPIKTSKYWKPEGQLMTDRNCAKEYSEYEKFGVIVGGAGSGNMWRGRLDGEIVELTKVWDTGGDWSSFLQIRIPYITTLESIYATATFDCLEMASGNWNLGEYKSDVDVPYIRFYRGAYVLDSFISCTAHVKFDALCTSSLTTDTYGTIDAEISFNYTKGDERIYVSAFLKSSKGTAYYML